MNSQSDIGEAPQGRPAIFVMGQSNALLLDKANSVERELNVLGSNAKVIGVHGPGQAVLGKNSPWNVTDKGTGSNAGSKYREMKNKWATFQKNNEDADVGGILWLQGEADLRNARANYEAGLTALFEQITEDFGSDFPITIVGLSDNMPRGKYGKSWRWKKIIKDQKAVAEKFDNVTYIDPDDVAIAAGYPEDNMNRDHVHYSKSFFKVLAKDVLARDEYQESLGLNTVEGGDTGDGADGGDVIESILGSGNNDEASEGAGNQVIKGSSRADKLEGGDGNDLIKGHSGKDKLYGNDGNDRIEGGRHNDTIEGGNGDDVLVGQQGRDVLKGQAGDDSLYGGRDKDWMHGGHGDDQLKGGHHNDRAYGGEGDDRLFGEHGRDMLDGNAGNDTLYGGSHADQLYGGLGEDQISGGHGNDTLTGGSKEEAADKARDVFVFGKNGGHDVIRGFEQGIDEIDLSGLDIEDVTVIADRDGNGITLDFGADGSVHIEDFDLSRTSTDDLFI